MVVACGGAVAVTHEELLLEIERTDAKTVLSTPEGRRWVWALLESAGVWSSSFESDALGMAFTSGRREVGLEVMRRLQRMLPGEYNLMVVEAAKAMAEAQMREQLKP